MEKVNPLHLLDELLQDLSDRWIKEKSLREKGKLMEQINKVLEKRFQLQND